MNGILDAIRETARHRPRSLALSDGRTEISYGDLHRIIAEVVARFVALFRRGGPVAFCARNNAAWVLTDLALLELGRVMVPLPTFFSPAQRQHAIEETGAAYVLTDRKPESGSQEDMLSVGGHTLFCITQEQSGGGSHLPRGTAKVTYTSGSTAQPKGVCLSMSGMETVAASLVQRIGIEHAGTHCALLPLAVLLENVAGLYATLLAGGHYHVPPPEALGLEHPFLPDFTQLVRGLEACAATSTIMVPELLRGTMAALSRDKSSLPELKILAVGGARVSPHLLADASMLGLPVVEGYGLTEMGSVVTLNSPSDNEPGTIGRPLPHVNIELAQDGELLLRNPIFLGYVGAGPPPQVFSCGDLGRFDSAGRVHFLGRKTQLIITSFGRNISPEWVESELLDEQGLAQAFVFGDGAPALGALIVPRSAAATTNELAEAIARANERLPDYALVRHWAVVPPFTVTDGQLTANGRLRRAEIAMAHGERMRRCLQQPGLYQSFYDRLVTQTGPDRATFQQIAQIQDALRGCVSRDSYLAYLREAYHHVKHTVPLMKLTRSKLTSAHGWLREALSEYIAEETGHELWILNDIQNAGGDPDAARMGSPNSATARMVAYAYDYITLVNPVGFFGMVYVLEGTSIELATRGAHALMQALELPPTCFSYLLSHGELDAGHLAFFRRLMDKMANEDDQAAIIEVAGAMFRLFGAVFGSIPHTGPVGNVA